MKLPNPETAGLRLLVFPNLIRGRNVTSANQLWATDFTYVRLLREYIYVNAIIDVYTRKIVGWSISRDLTHEFCLEAIKSAVKKTARQRASYIIPIVVCSTPVKPT